MKRGEENPATGGSPPPKKQRIESAASSSVSEADPTDTSSKPELTLQFVRGDTSAAVTTLTVQSNSKVADVKQQLEPLLSLKSSEFYLKARNVTLTDDATFKGLIDGDVVTVFQGDVDHENPTSANLLFHLSDEQREKIAQDMEGGDLDQLRADLLKIAGVKNVGKALKQLKDIQDSAPRPISTLSVRAAAPAGAAAKAAAGASAGATEGLKAFQQSPIDPPSQWHNWARTVNYNVQHTYPKSREELKQVLEIAKKDNKKVRVVGDGHSWAPVIAGNGVILVHMAGPFWRQIEPIVTGGKKFVKLGPGVQTGQLALWFDTDPKAKELGFQHWGFEADAVLDTVMYASLVLSCCHGLSNRQGFLADSLEAITFMDGNGVETEYVRSKTDPKLWSAASASWGLFGICTSLTLAVEGPKQVVIASSDQTLDFLLSAPEADIKDWLISTRDSKGNKVPCTGVEVFWFPLNSASKLGKLDKWKPEKDRLYSRHLRDLTADEEKKPVEVAWSDSWRGAFKGKGFKDAMQLYLGNAFTSFDAALGSSFFLTLFPKFQLTMLPKGSLISSRSAANHYYTQVDIWDKLYNMEIGFKLTSFETISKLLKATVTIVKEWITSKKQNPVDVGVEFRLTRRSEAILTPAHAPEDDNSYFLFLEILGTANNEYWWTVFAPKIRKAWLDIAPPGTAKLHWCKWHEPDDQSEWKGIIQNMYKDELAVFAPYVKERDPEGRFRTWFWEQMLFGKF